MAGRATSKNSRKSYGSRGKRKKTSTGRSEAAPDPNGRRREILGVVLLALGLTLVLALWSFTPQDQTLLEKGYPSTHNLIGPAGHHVARALLAAAGLGSFVLATAILAAALACFTKRRLHLTVIEAAGYTLLTVFGAALAHLSLVDVRPFSQAPGGAIGAVTGEMLRAWFNTTGAVIVTGAVVLLAFMVASDFTVARLFGGATRRLAFVIGGLASILQESWARSLARRAERTERRAKTKAEKAARREAAQASKEAARLERIAKLRSEGAIEADERGLILDSDDDSKVDVDDLPRQNEAELASSTSKPAVNHSPIPDGPLGSIAPADEVAPSEAQAPSRHSEDLLTDPDWADPEWAAGLSVLGADRPEHCNAETEANGCLIEEPVMTSGAVDSNPSSFTNTSAPAEANDDPPKIRTNLGEKAAKTRSEEKEPQIIKPKSCRPTAAKSTSRETFAYTTHGDKFVLPSLDFLTPPLENPNTEVDRKTLVETARRLKEKLSHFGIAGEVVQIRPGPVITMYEFRPGPGIKISKIQSLTDDLAMAMEAFRVRIVAPIPGKNAVGIEVPNPSRQTVYAREILEQDKFLKTKSRLTMGMGKGIEGDPVIVDLAKMPHLLMAGTTGSGKSVAINSMITSMLYKATPDEVRFIMIDPKVLELKLYEGIPHLLLPVVTDPTKAALALRWATEEMDRRYHLLAELNVRDLASFNKKVARLREEWEEKQADSSEEEQLGDPPPEHIPMLVIVIDELADLMMVASRDVETYIARLAQKARAAGIHLLVATQRPSTDVLTGVIKINFPARISFRVASRHDSQTIINEPGAEKLLGNGDMLLIPPGQSEPMRAHGAFLSEDEIERVVAHLKTQGKPVYDQSILQPRDDGVGSDANDDDAMDPKWDEAMAIVNERDTISVSWIQRRLAIGYNRAARMIEKMEREGIVGPADGSKPREVLLNMPPP